VDRMNTKTIGKHGEVVDKPLYKCIIEGLRYACGRMVSQDPGTRVHEI